MGRVEVVVGGQFGSEGKGAIAAYLGADNDKLAAVRVAGPNAGHSALDERGKKWALRQIPVVAVSNTAAQLVIGAGSEIDPDVLSEEIASLEAGGIPITCRLWIDRQATEIVETNKKTENFLSTRIGSTGKGIGAARADRIMREAPIWGDWSTETEVMLGRGVDTVDCISTWLDDGWTVMIEGTQGFGLGLHAGYYPFCTSSDCRAIDFLAMTGISPWADVVEDLDVWVVLRTHPIRVAGPSGPLKGETTWDRLSADTGGYIQPERTTVTKKVRRVGTWDSDLAAKAIQANGGPYGCRVALTFFDYWYPELADATEPSALEGHHWDQLEEVERQIGVRPELLGTGPGTVIDLRKGR